MDLKILRIATAGSVDDGKSTLIGRLLYETRSLKSDQLEHIKSKSCNLGYDYIDFSLATDGLLTEREQGITIDVSNIYFKTAQRRFIIADSPGHVEYTRNMVTGASNAEVAVILIDVRNGVVEQTKRHLYITQLLGIKHLIFAINKMDLIAYDAVQFKSNVAQIKQLLGEHEWCQKVNFIPISALKGDNIISLSKNTPWYKEKSLLTLMETLDTNEEIENDTLLQVQYVIRPKTDEYHDYRAYAGKIKSGFFKSGDAVTVFPSGLKTKIKALEKYGIQKKQVVAGENVAVLLEDEMDISRGNSLVKTNHTLKTGTQIEAKICWMQADRLNQNGKLWLQHGIHKSLIKIKKIHSKMEWSLWQSVTSNSLGLNDIGKVCLQTAQPLLYAPFLTNPKLGAFILIDPNTNNTAGVGFIQ